MIEPVLKDQALLMDIEQAIAPDEGIALWWLGQSGYVVKYQSTVIYIDPYLSESLTHKYALTNKPHVRMTASPLQPDLIHHADWILSSHKHTDHMDPQTLLPMMQASPTVRCVIAQAHWSHALAMGLPAERLLGVVADQSVMLTQDIQLLPIPSAHEQLETDALGHHVYLGFILKLGRFTLYHSGDTIPYPGLMQRLLAQRIDLAMLPINGRDARRHALGTPGNCTIEEALCLATLAGVGTLVPHHYDLFTFNTVPAQQFKDWAQEAFPQQRVLVMQPGERHLLGNTGEL